MINRIIDGISLALNAEFGDDYRIHTELIEQGLVEPCFSIVCLNPNSEQSLGNRYFRQNKFCVHYFPDSENKVSECMNVLERLLDCLEIITVDDSPTRGIKMSGEMDGGVLHFFVNYDFYVIKQTEEADAMEHMELKQETGG